MSAMRRTVAAGSLAAAVVLFLPSCDAGCKETVTDADDAAVVDISDVGSSGILQARLTAKDKPVADRGVDFRVRLRTGRYRFVGEASTDANGLARFDLKQSPPDLAEGVLGDSYRATFAGDGRYCSSRDDADLATAE
jgi:hypothetical protein